MVGLLSSRRPSKFLKQERCLRSDERHDGRHPPLMESAHDDPTSIIHPPQARNLPVDPVSHTFIMPTVESVDSTVESGRAIPLAV